MGPACAEGKAGGVAPCGGGVYGFGVSEILQAIGTASPVPNQSNCLLLHTFVATRNATDIYGAQHQKSTTRRGSLLGRRNIGKEIARKYDVAPSTITRYAKSKDKPPKPQRPKIATQTLTQRQKAFCDQYLIDLNATQSAIRAGYSRHTAKEQATSVGECSRKAISG